MKSIDLGIDIQDFFMKMGFVDRELCEQIFSKWGVTNLTSSNEFTDEFYK